MNPSKSDFDAAADIQAKYEEAGKATENIPIVKFGQAVERARARRSSSAAPSIPVPTVKEPERITLAQGLAILERHLSPDQAKVRIRGAFTQKALDQEPLFAFPYDKAEIDWATG